MTDYASAGDVPDFLKTYVTSLLDKAQTAAGSPYYGFNAYKDATGRNPVADINPALRQANTTAMGLGPTSQLTTSTNMANNAGIASLDAGKTYNAAATDPTQMQSWMSPYISNVLNRQKTGAVMDYARQMPTLGAGAAKAGGLGGSRSAIMEAEGQRNLGNRLMDIDATGMQNAWDAANKNMQFGAELGLRGAGQAVEAANSLTNTGNAEFNQKLEANKNLQATGKTLYDIEQNTADKQLADFQAMMNDPMKKTEFFSGILGKIPVANKSGQAESSASGDYAALIAALANYFKK